MSVQSVLVSLCRIMRNPEKNTFLRQMAHNHFPSFFFVLSNEVFHVMSFYKKGKKDFTGVLGLEKSALDLR